MANRRRHCRKMRRNEEQDVRRAQCLLDVGRACVQVGRGGTSHTESLRRSLCSKRHQRHHSLCLLYSPDMTMQARRDQDDKEQTVNRACALSTSLAWRFLCILLQDGLSAAPVLLAKVKVMCVGYFSMISELSTNDREAMLTSIGL